MKAPITLVTAALVWGNTFSTPGQEAVTAVPDTRPDVPPTTLLAGSVPTAATNAGLVSVFSETTLRNLGISPNARVVSVMTNRLDVVESRRARVEGGLVPMIKRPSLLTFVQLFNPFAPAEYGGMGDGPPGSGFSRAFADPIKTYPTSPLISVGGKPPKSIARQRADTP